MPSAAHMDFHARHFAPTAYRTGGNAPRRSFTRVRASARTLEKRAAEARSAAAGVCPACFSRRSLTGLCAC
jgi:hypothetical protein